MTLDEALAAANRVSKRDDVLVIDDAEALAKFVIDLFSTQMPCGYDEPRVVTSRVGGLTLVEFDGSTYEPDEARGIAVAMLRAADLAAKGGR